MKRIFSQKGFSLMEILIAVMIVLGVWAATSQVFLKNIILADTNRNTTQALNDLNDVMETIRDWPLAYLLDMYDSGVGPPYNANIIPPGTITPEFTLLDEQITLTYLEVPNVGPIDIMVTVSWAQNKRTLSVSSRTLKYQ